MNFIGASLRISRLAHTTRVQSRRALSSSSAALSGHNKWSKIKDKKAKEDKARGSLYTKAVRDIVVAVRTGGSTDPVLNIALANVLKRAKQDAIPKSTIENALAKAGGGKDGAANIAMTFEAIAHGTVGIIIETLTNNKNRTAGDIMNILKDHGSARTGKVDFMFERKGVIRASIEPNPAEEEQLNALVEDALEAEAEDFDSNKDGEKDPTEVELVCAPEALSRVTQTVLGRDNVTLISSELAWRPKEAAELGDEIEESVSELVDELEEHEDTMRVWTTLG
ncbi:YebC-like protein [Peniophora sp. CONT]|nr:YebC-like protein [Peniophora sp. CONT]